jgi:hypothetical protein
MDIVTSTSMKIGVLHPGEMGAALGAALQDGGREAIFACAGRSEATIARARDAGLMDVVTLDQLREQAGLFVKEAVDGFVVLESGGIEMGHAAGRQNGGRLMRGQALRRRARPHNPETRDAAIGARGIGGAPDGSRACGSKVKAATSFHTVCACLSRSSRCQPLR